MKSMDNMKCQCVILSALTTQVLPSSFLLFLLTTPSSLASFPYLFPASKLYSVNATIIIFVSVLYFPLSLLPSPSLFHIHLFPLSYFNFPLPSPSHLPFPLSPPLHLPAPPASGDGGIPPGDEGSRGHQILRQGQGHRHAKGP